ncbi:MAG: tetratricopeptide repeat-containing sensor histidine kinase [Candidatus Cloacimonetes bacterium]|nr:tetratricopeptide repeat-containing sensor histidine kinase [Candidatus Cloacimonadota bacterium]
MKKSIFIILILLYFSLYSESIIDSLEIKLSKKKGLEKISILNELSYEYSLINKEKSIGYLNQALKIAEKENNSEDIISNLNNLGIRYEFFNEPDSAFYFYNKAIKLGESSNDFSGVALSYLNKAFLQLSRYNYSDALSTVNKAKEYSILASDSINVAQCYNLRGRIFVEIMDHESALENFLIALKITRNTDNKPYLARCYNHIGVHYLYLKNNEKSLEYFNKALKIHEELDDKEGIAVCNNNLGNAYEDLEEYVIALKYYKKSLELDNELGYSKGIFMSYHNIGSTYLSLKNYEKAKYYFEEVLELLDQIGDEHSKIDTYLLLGVLNFEQKKNQSAKFYYEKSLKLALELDNASMLLPIYSSLAEWYSSQKQMGDAYKYIKLFSTIKDSIFTDENKQKVNKMQIRLATEKKEHEIQLLTKDSKIKNIQISRQRQVRNLIIVLLVLACFVTIVLYNRYRFKVRANNELRKANIQISEQKTELMDVNENQEKLLVELNKLNATKDKFFSIISHDLKNAFSSMISGSRLLSVHIEHLDKETIKNLSLEMKVSINNLYKLLENLLSWSRLQTENMAIVPEKFSLEIIIDDVLQILDGSIKSKKIKIHKLIEKNSIIYADKNMIKSVFQNIMYNAIKFTNLNGNIKLMTKKQGKNLVLKVIDDGLGISETNLNKLFKLDQNFKNTGTADEKGTGLGLILCKEFIEKNNGTIQIESEINKGTTVVIILLNRKN